MQTYRTIPRPEPTDKHAVLAELRAMRAEMAALRALFDHFAGVLLNAKFPHGRPVDRWGRR